MMALQSRPLWRRSPFMSLVGSVLVHAAIVLLLPLKGPPRRPTAEPLLIEFGFGEEAASSLTEDPMPGLPKHLLDTTVHDVKPVLSPKKIKAEVHSPPLEVSVPVDEKVSPVMGEGLVVTIARDLPAVNDEPKTDAAEDFPAMVAMSTSPAPLDTPVGDGVGSAQGHASLGKGTSVLPIVQQRINYVAHLLAPSSQKLAGGGGVATIDMQVNNRGYVSAMRIAQIFGTPLPDVELDNILHFAEPFPVWEGWLTVEVHW